MLNITKNQTGISMVEVLVALVVIGVGMLGVASLYVVTLQAKTTAQSRMKAINLAYDMADRIRANRVAGSNYVVATSTTLSAPASTANCVENSATAAVTCTATQMAANDLYLWDQSMKDPIKGLPGNVQRSIAYTAPVTNTSPGIYTITVQWSEPNSTSAQSYTLQVQI